jgi:hypothetical protein
MAKLNWEIHHPDYGRQGIIVANTRANAIAIAEANHLAQQGIWGPYVQHCYPIPAFTAKKVPKVDVHPFDFAFYFS